MSEDGHRVLFFDLETAGVQGLSADRGFVVCFGYMFEGDRQAKCLTVLDHPGKDIHDDTQLLKAAYKIMEEADLVVAHYGAKFDRPYLEARLSRARLKPLPNTRILDTCLIARSRYRLSSSRLGNLATFLGVKHLKLEKRSGWPDWWMGALRGDSKSIRSMADYCKQDVECLADVYSVMRPMVPARYLLHRGIGLARYVCSACGGNVNYHGRFFSEKKMWRRFQCIECGKWGREDKPIARPFNQHQPPASDRARRTR